MVMTTERQLCPGLRDCREAVRRIRATPGGRRALGSLRPRGVSGVYRDRLPTALLLYLGAREHRLVWQDAGGLALLEPPLARPEIWRQHRLGLVGVLRFVDAWWSVLTFVVPLAALLALSVLLGLVLGQPGPAIVVALLVLVCVALAMTIQVVWGFVTLRRETPQKNALGAVTADRWTMSLFHQENGNRIDELLDRVRGRVDHLVRVEAEQAARDRGLEIGSTRLSAEVVHPHAGVTTDIARSRVAERYPIVHEGVSLARSDRRPDDPERRPYRPIRFVGLFLATVVGLVAGLAGLVMDSERDGCATDGCATAPTTYVDALLWCLYRLVGVNAPGIVPATPTALVLGWLITILGVTTALVILTGISTHLRRSRELKVTMEGPLLGGATRLLLVTVADEELDAVLDAFEQHTGRPAEQRFDRAVSVHEMGQINDTEVVVVQTAQGVTNAGGAIITTAAAVQQIDPHYALIVGMCWGLRPGEQEIGDILVSEKIEDLDHGKIIDDSDGNPVEILRGERARPSDLVVGAVRAAQRSWGRKGSGAPVRIGPMLAWSKLVDSESAVQRLQSEHRDAIGADMEGAGFYAAARAGRVESVLIKAICDWGHGRDSNPAVLREGKRTACRNSADFVLHLVLSGVFVSTPAERVGR